MKIIKKQAYDRLRDILEYRLEYRGISFLETKEPDLSGYRAQHKSIVEIREEQGWNLDFKEISTKVEETPETTTYITLWVPKNLSDAELTQVYADALVEAVEVNDVEETRRLITREGVNVNSRKGRVRVIPLGGFEITPLLLAVKKYNSLILNTLIELGAHPDLRHGWLTPLTVAARNGWYDGVRLLIEAGANPNKSGSRHTRSPLALALKCKYFGIAKLLLKAGARRTKFNTNLMKKVGFKEENS